MSAETVHPSLVVIGTAGHVDHGKTSLVRALTGIDTDRLKEEQERELSIDLGFAYFDLPDGTRAGIVDVPGHERFIKNMLAGASGLDVVLLVIAADEGVMPQTQEHLDIVSLLGVQAGLIVLTKADLVDEEWLELVAEQVREAVRGTLFEAAPLVTTSAATREGYDELIAELTRVLQGVRRHDPRGPLRLPVDRVFTMPGFGTVITGPLIRGTIGVGDTVAILPRGEQVRVRGLQVHGAEVPRAAAAQRLAVNLARVSTAEVQRGDVLAAPGTLRPSYLLDARLRLLGHAPRELGNRERVRVHHGTAAVLARAKLLDRDVLRPGEDALVQLMLEAPLAAARDDRFVIRTYSPMLTVGGGTIIDPAARRRRRYDREGLARLARHEARDTAAQAADWVRQRAAKPFRSGDLARELQLDAPEAEELLAQLVAEDRVRDLGEGRAVATVAADELGRQVLGAVESFHREQPLQPAMPKHLLQTATGRPSEYLLDYVLAELAAAGAVQVGGDGVRLGGHEVALTAAQQQVLGGLLAHALREPFAPPTREELLRKAGGSREAAELLELALRQGDLVALGEYVFHREALARARQLVAEHVREHGPFTVAEFRDIVGSTRKYVVPLLEYLDRTGFTRRRGDLRTVAEE